MTKLSRTLRSTLIGFTLCSGTAAMADILAKDTFAYPAGTPLAGAEGGSGNWDGPWTVSEGTTSAKITDAGLSFGDGTGNPSAKPGSLLKAARRIFSKYSGDVLYVKFTFSAGEGTTAHPDRFGTFLPSYEHGALLIGTGLDGAGSEIAGNSISVRTFDNSKHRVSSKNTLSPEPTTVVVEWSKSVGGANTPYNRMRVWFNPTPADRDSATYKEMSHSELRPAVSAVGFYIAESDPGDVFSVKEVAVATTWEEVVGQP